MGSWEGAQLPPLPPDAAAPLPDLTREAVDARRQIRGVLAVESPFAAQLPGLFFVVAVQEKGSSGSCCFFFASLRHGSQITDEYAGIGVFVVTDKRPVLALRKSVLTAGTLTPDKKWFLDPKREVTVEAQLQADVEYTIVCLTKLRTPQTAVSLSSDVFAVIPSRLNSSYRRENGAPANTRTSRNRNRQQKKHYSDSMGSMSGVP